MFYPSRTSVFAFVVLIAGLYVAQRVRTRFNYFSLRLIIDGLYFVL